MRRRVLLTAFLSVLLLPFSVKGQNAQSSAVADGTLRIPRTFSDETQLPSPEAAQMLRYTDYPISYATGTVDVTVPLYTVEVGGYSLPLALSYHTSGVKADEEECLAGLGWSLQCGGSITRTIHGRPDEQRPFDLRNAGTVLSSEDTLYLKNVLHRHKDANHDRYNYRLPGYSGSFIIAGSSIVQIPSSDLRIEQCDNVSEGVRNFMITTPDGTRYRFAEREHTNYHYAPIAVSTAPDYLSADYNVVTGWHLSEIVLPTRADTLYDSEDRPADVWESDIRGGTRREQTTYTLDGRPLTRTVTHTTTVRNQPTVLNEYYTYQYDNAARLSTVTHRLNNGSTVTLTSNSYDALGRITQDSRNGSSPLLTSYGYDLHGWLTGISSTLFSESLYYESNPFDTVNSSYTGTITGMERKADETVMRGYDLAYDRLGRLTRASYYADGEPSGRYDTHYSYDAMGNLTSLKRKTRFFSNNILIDNLSLQYSGNHLVKVTDTGNANTFISAMQFQDGADLDEEYEYDANGNLTKDANKGILSVSYNALNLPDSIMLGGRTGNLYNNYSGDGQRLRTQFYHINVSLNGSGPTPSLASTLQPVKPPPGNLFTTDTVSYCGNVVFGGDSIRYILVDGGYVTSPLTTPEYHFYLRDHLGSNRVVYSSTGAVEQKNHSYPYGMPMDASTNASRQPYKYNGKELVRSAGLNWLDYGARWHDPILGRWHSMDSRCEDYYSISPYAYCAGDPVNNVDLAGSDILPVLYTKTDNSGNATGVQYYSVNSFKKAMNRIGRTSFGNKFLSSFLNIQNTQYGVKGNGKYADYILKIEEYAIPYESNSNTGNFLYLEDNFGGSNIDEIDGKLVFILRIDCLDRTIDEMSETINHEMSLHFYKYEQIIEAYKKGGIEAAKEVYNRPSEKEEHDDLSRSAPKYGGALYKRTKIELEKQKRKIDEK